MDIIVDNLLKDLEALRSNIDIECRYWDPTRVSRDKYERVNEMLSAYLNIIKEECINLRGVYLMEFP